MRRLSASVHLAVFLAGLFLLLLPAWASHRRRTRAGENAAIVATVRRLPSADFSLSGSGRHLRHISLAEPGAAFSDVVAGPDLDPAGGALAPPREVW